MELRPEHGAWSWPWGAPIGLLRAANLPSRSGYASDSARHGQLWF